MTFKKVIVLIILAIFVSGCTAKKDNTASGQKPSNSNSKVLLNELEFSKRPFVSLIPHSTNRLFTFYAQNIDKATEASIDIEYQSGDLLKGVKANIDTPIPNQYSKGIILGSCSSGGKCSFDKDLKSGTSRLRMKFPGSTDTHLLKGEFTFIQGQQNLPDGKVSFTPSKQTAKDNIIMMNSFGLPKTFDKEITLYPIVFSAATDKAIVGELSISSQATEAFIYDGASYQPVKFTTKDGRLSISLNQKPWTLSAEIVRDDEKGSKEQLVLDLVGPIVLVK